MTATAYFYRLGQKAASWGLGVSSALAVLAPGAPAYGVLAFQNGFLDQRWGRLA